MNSFALFRLPYRQKCTLIVQHGTSSQLSGIGSIDTLPGFVVAPFDTASLPTLIIKPDIVKQYANHLISASTCEDINRCCYKNATAGADYSPTRADYSADFTRFHDRLLDGGFSKLVLSRKAVEPCDQSLTPIGLFTKACVSYPRLFIALFSAPNCGNWLVATPELLVRRQGNLCNTMALAGTMPYDPEKPAEWSRKNIEEQQYVTSYILDAISPFAKYTIVSGPNTVRAGQLVHLRSQISFTTESSTPTSAIVEALHPTPAVCGLPKSSALPFILDNEHCKRDYYSGFCGPCDGHGNIRLFVSLRCMRLCHSSYELFAGGGLLKASNEESEWRETESKMQTMKRLTQNY